MRRLARRLFTVCSAVSLVLCVAVCVLWGRSYWVQDTLTWSSGRYDPSSPVRVTRVISMYGIVAVMTMSIPATDLDSFPEIPDRLTHNVDPVEDVPPAHPSFWGRFGFIHDQQVMWSITSDLRAAPYWLFALVAALPVAAKSWMVVRSRWMRGVWPSFLANLCLKPIRHRFRVRNEDVPTKTATPSAAGCDFDLWSDSPCSRYHGWPSSGPRLGKP